MSKNLMARIAVAAVAIPIILWICYQGGYWLLGMISLFALIAIAEYAIAENQPPSGAFFWGMLITAAIYFGLGFALYWTNTDSGPVGSDYFKYVIILSLAIIATPMVFFVVMNLFSGLTSRPPDAAFSRAARLIWGVMYVFWLYPFVFLLGETVALQAPSGGDLLLFLFGLLWVGDTAAMFGGKAFGRHKLAPSVSPNKTVEGFISGIVAAAVIGLVMYFWKLEWLPVYQVLIIAVGASIFGQLGDLVESLWKRSLGIKDSSAIIPGHGGVLDRFDSLLFAAPFTYCYLLLYTLLK